VHQKLRIDGRKHEEKNVEENEIENERKLTKIIKSNFYFKRETTQKISFPKKEKNYFSRQLSKNLLTN